MRKHSVAKVLIKLQHSTMEQKEEQKSETIKDKTVRTMIIFKGQIGLERSIQHVTVLAVVGMVVEGIVWVQHLEEALKLAFKHLQGHIYKHQDP